MLRVVHTNLTSLGLFVPYNVLSMAQSARRKDILSAYAHASCLMLQGTRTRKVEHSGSEDYPNVTEHCEPGFACISAGYERRSNRHAGVETCVRRRDFDKKDIAYISSPQDACLYGRALALRLRSSRCDYLVLNMYYPLSGTAGTTVKRMVAWVWRFLFVLRSTHFAHIGHGRQLSLGAEAAARRFR